jgi:hypothetical protein
MRRLLLCAVLVPGLAAAEIYRWTDASGQVHFDEKPQAGAVQVEVKAPALQNDTAAVERQQRADRFFDARREEQQQASEKNRVQVAKVAQECQRLRTQYADLERGGTFYKVDTQGERVYYDEAQINRARTQLKTRLTQGCN